MIAIASSSGLRPQRRANTETCHPYKRQSQLHTFRDRQCWTPLLPQDVKTDRPVRVDVRVVDLGREADLWRLEGVIGGEGNGKEEDTAGIW